MSSTVKQPIRQRIKYMSNSERKISIFKSAVACALKKGLFKITVIDVAIESGCSEDLVKWHYRGIKKIREEVVNYAKTHGVQEILNTPIMNILQTTKYMSSVERTCLIFACTLELYEKNKDCKINDIAELAGCTKVGT